MQLPYKPLVTVIKRLEIVPDLAKVAWNFVNDWKDCLFNKFIVLRTTLCLQYKPPYVAAGPLYLAAKLQKVKLPTEKGRVWWQEFDISLKQLEEVIQEMRRLLGQDRKQAFPSTNRLIQSKAVTQKPLETSPQSCMSSSESVTNSHSSRGNSAEERSCSQNLVEGNNCTTVKSVLPCRTSDSGSASGVVEEGDCEVQPKTIDSDHSSRSKAFSAPNNSMKIDVTRIREALKRRKTDGVVRKSVEVIGAEMGSEAWIESELDNGIEIGDGAAEKKQRHCEVLN